MPGLFDICYLGLRLLYSKSVESTIRRVEPLYHRRAN